MFTRKHFQAIAEIVSNIKSDKERKQVAEAHASSFAKENPRFDRNKFLTACKVKA